MNKGYLIEQLNPNDTEFLVVARHFEDGEKTVAGKLLFEVEGQKTTFEILSEVSGWVTSKFVEGSYIQASEFLYFVEDDEEEVGILRDSKEIIDSEDYEKINHALDNILPLEKLSSPKIRIAVIPGGKAFRQVEDALNGNLYFELVGYFDDHEDSSVKRLGALDFDKIEEAHAIGVFDRVFVATGSASFRTNLLNSISCLGIKVINVIHPTSYLASSAVLGSNIFVGPNCHIGSKTNIKSGTFMSSFSNIEHHCFLGENVLLGPGVMLSGSVKIGDRTVLGAGVAVESNLVIGNDVYVRSGKGVTMHVKDASRIID